MFPFWPTREHLPSAKKTDNPLTKTNRDRSFSQPKRALDRVWMLSGIFGCTRLCLETEGAGASAIRQESAKFVLVFLSMERQTEELEGTKRQRQVGRFSERALVIAVELRTTQRVNQFAIVERSGFASENAGVSRARVLRISSSTFNPCGHANSIASALRV